MKTPLNTTLRTQNGKIYYMDKCKECKAKDAFTRRLGPLTDQEVVDMWNKYNNKCQLCEKELERRKEKEKRTARFEKAYKESIKKS